MINWDDVERLGLDQDTDAVIASTMATLTLDYLDSTDAARYLREQSLWYQSGPIAMSGDIETAMPSLPASLQDLLGQLYAAIWGESATALRTDDPVWGPIFAEGVDGLIAAGVMSQTQADELADLAGGKPWTGATEADAAAARAAHEAEVAVQQVQSDYNAALNTAGVNEAYANGDRAGLVTALRAAADILEA